MVKAVHLDYLKSIKKKQGANESWIDNVNWSEFLHKLSLCDSMNSLFSIGSRKYCCDANIVASKCVNF